MASSRRRRRARGDALGVLGGAGLVLLAISAVASHPVVLAAIVVLVVSAGGALVLVRYRRYARRLRQAELDRIRYSHIEPYLSMAPSEFERALAFLCQRDGCTGTQVVGGAGDLGADVVATTPLGHKLVIQAKRYSHSKLVTGPDLQKFGGTCYAVHGADVAVVITTSGFTRQARDYAARMRIWLFDQQALAAWVSRTGMPPWPTSSP